MSSETSSSLDVVNARMEAHNQHDLEQFLSLYSEEIQIYDYPDLPLGSPGKSHIEGIFGPLFEENAVHVEIHNQIVNGNYVVNHETVVRRGEEFFYISIYEIVGGLIKSVRFVRGNS